MATAHGAGEVHRQQIGSTRKFSDVIDQGPRFAFLDLFAMFNLPIGLSEIIQHGTTP
jgi:hypothetical protein